VLFPALFGVAIFVAALVPKANFASVAFCLGLLAVLPSEDQAIMLLSLYIPALVLAAFRD